MRALTFIGLLSILFVSVWISEVSCRRGGGRARVSRTRYYRSSRYENEEYNSNRSSDNSSSSDGGLSVVAIVCIVIASLLVFIGAVVLVAYFCYG